MVWALPGYSKSAGWMLWSGTNVLWFEGQHSDVQCTTELCAKLPNRLCPSFDTDSPQELRIGSWGRPMRTVEIVDEPGKQRRWVAVEVGTCEPPLRLHDRDMLQNICQGLGWCVTAAQPVITSAAPARRTESRRATGERWRTPENKQAASRR
jgi:hypothetical protein